MNRSLYTPCLCLLLLLFTAASPRVGRCQQNGQTVRRFAFVVGANDGGPGRGILRYAHSDARAFSAVLGQLGGVERKAHILLLEPDRFDMEAGFARMHTMLENAQGSGVRLELIFYYSGHSNEKGLLVGDDLFSYRELREILAELPTDVRIAILDSCSSGALTRSKGGRKRAPFLIDTSVDVRGYAYLTSASAHESAQEADSVGGSFFTHYLVSGLRGAADNSRDDRVTLNEAYQYAFDETLARTESSRVGPQHANYDFQLAGSGDLVLTDLRGTAAQLVIEPAAKGRFYVRDRRGHLVAELNKSAERPMRIGLDPGVYEITYEMGGRVSRGRVTLGRGDEVALRTSDLDAFEGEMTVSRGTKEPARETREAFDKDGDGLVERPLAATFVPGVSTDKGAKGPVLNNVALNFVGWGHTLRGVEASYVGAIRKGDVLGVQGSGTFNWVRGSVQGVQGSGGLNFAGESVRGLQVAGAANVSGGPVRGLQVAAAANVNRGSFVGAQFASLFNINGGGESHGFQTALLGNVSGGSLRGAQLALLANLSREQFTGAQFSMLVNSNLTETTGLQMGVLGNYTRDLRGLQLSLFNAALGRVRGAQVGLFNLAGDVKGPQVGLINISTKKNSGATVGLINYAGDGVLAPAVWTGDDSAMNLGLKIGSRHLFTILGAGLHPILGNKRHSIFWGLGTKFDFTRDVFFEVDLLWNRLYPESDWRTPEQDHIFSLRLTPGVRIGRGLSIFGGPTVNLLLSEARDRASGFPSLWHVSVGDKGQYHMRQSIGLTLGIQFEPKWGDLNPF